MQGIYTYNPETNHVPTKHCVAAILMQLFMVLISLVPVLTPLYLYVSSFRSMCAVLNMAVFCSSLTSWFPGVLLTYYYYYFFYSREPYFSVAQCYSYSLWHIHCYLP